MTNPITSDSEAQSEAPSVDNILEEIWFDGGDDNGDIVTSIREAKAKINRLIVEAYKKGYIDGGIGVINEQAK